MDIGDRIKSLRQERGYSQKELAKVLNISPSCLSKYETNKSQIPPETLISIADTLNVSLDYIFGRSDFLYNFNSLNDYYINKIKLYTILNESLSLNSNNRRILWGVLKALKCQNEIERMKTD